jgi:putative FmdB family regulatory protein
MPSYEYYCRPCDKTFSVRLSIKDHDTQQVTCPHCHGTEVEQIFSSFVAMTSKKS